MKRGGPLKRYAQLRRKTALKAESVRHARDERVLAKVKLRLIERAGYACEAHPILGPCDGPLHAHHKLRRSQGGKHTLANLVLLCRYHHAWVHQHPAQAEALGLLTRPGSLHATATIRDAPSYIYGVVRDDDPETAA